MTEGRLWQDLHTALFDFVAKKQYGWTTWGGGLSLGSPSYVYGPTGGSGVNRRHHNARWHEQRWGAKRKGVQGRIWRGMHMAGPAALSPGGTGSAAGTSNFSQVWPSTLARGGATPTIATGHWAYEGAAGLSFIGRGNPDFVIFAQRWERLVGTAGQPSSNPATGAGTEWQAYLDALTSLPDSLKSMFMLFNYAAFYKEDISSGADTASRVGRRTHINHITAAGTVTVNDYTDKMMAWTAGQLQGNEKNIGIVLIDEPVTTDSNADNAAWLDGPNIASGSELYTFDAAAQVTQWQISAGSKAHETGIFKTGTGSMKITRDFGVDPGVYVSTQIRSNVAEGIDATNCCHGAWIMVEAGAAGTDWRAYPAEFSGASATFAKIPTNTATVTSKFVKLLPGYWVWVWGTDPTLLAGGNPSGGVGFEIGGFVGAGSVNIYVDSVRRGPRSHAACWQATAQNAVTAMRHAGYTKLLLVPGYQWTPWFNWASQNPLNFISDPGSNFAYDLHHFIDDQGNGTYTIPYAEEVALAIADNF
jgi:hypothetical protein